MADNVEMQGIEFQIVNDSAAASAGVEVLAKKLAELKASISGSTTALSKVAAGIAGIKNAVNGVSVSGFESKMSRISASLAKLKTQTDNLKISASIGNQLTNIGNAVNALPDSYGKLSQLADSLKPLSELGKSNLSSFISQLGKIPTVVKDLGQLDMAKFSQQMKDLASAMKPLAEEMSRVSAGFSAFPSRIQALIASTEQYSNTVQRAAGRTSSWGISLKSIFSMALYRAAYKKLSDLIYKASQYTETINLFTVSMGEYAKEAFDYAQKVSDVVGIDVSEWMQKQGVFNTIITGFGVAGDKAAFMSKNLTQLGYDLSSFYNIDVASAMQKVQAGISGELEPLRQLGYDLSAAKLQEEASALGITKQVSAMDQAEKSMLRYHAIMTQVTVAQGDMARTLDAPANQLRILKSQFNLAAREIGNLFIPALNAILPYAIAAAKAIRAVAASIANLFGIQLASVDYSGISGASGAAADLNDNLASAGGSAAELKNQLAGFDELNVIQSQSGGGGGGGSGGGTNDLEDMELPGYDFLKDAVSTNIDRIYNKIKPVIDWVTEHLQEIGLIVGTIGATMLAWKISTNLANALNWTQGTLSTIHGLLLGAASAVITIGVSYILEKKGLAGGQNENWGDLIASWITSAVGSAVTGGIVKKMLGATAGQYAAGVTLLLSATASIKNIYDDVKADGADWKTFADSVWAAIKGAIGGGILAAAAGGSVTLGVLAGGGLVLAGIGLAIGIANIEVETKEAKWGNLSLTKEQVTQYVQDELFTIDVKATVGAIDTTLSELNSQKGKLNAAIESFNQSLTMVKLGVDEQGSYEKMLYALTGGASDGTYTETSILGQLESVTGQSHIAVELGFSTLIGDDDTRINLNNLLDTSDSIIQSETTKIGQELARLLAKGVNEGLIASEQEMALQLSDTLSRVAQAVTQEKINTEFLSNLTFSLADMDQGSFDSVLEQFGMLKAQLREQYQAIATTTLAGMRSRYTALIDLGTPEALDEAKKLEAEIDEYSKTMVSYVDEAVERVSGQGADMIAQRVQEIFSGAITTDIFQGFFSLKEYLNNAFSAAAMSGDVLSTDDIAELVNDVILASLKGTLSNEDFSSITKAAEATGQSLFKMLPQDVQSGLYSYLGDFLSSDNVKNYLGGDYTTQVFESLGYDMGNNFQTGFSDTVLNVQTGFSAGQQILQGIATVDFRGAGSAAFSQFASGFGGGSLSSVAESAASGLDQARKKIRGFATGGYPKSGELFWARENGTPEMVGKMGGNTAVANNDQIVSGIASGVSSANAESNALLREQNELLRRLLQKEFTAEVTPSAELGRVVARSSRMYEKAYG